MIQKTKQRKKPANRESKLQAACVRWFRYQYPKFRKLLFSIPNGASSGTKIQRINAGKKMKAEGALAGAADLFLAIPSGEYPGLFIEMKTKSKGSSQADNQREFETAVVGQGFGYVVPRTFTEFETIVKSYLERGEFQ